MDKYIPLAGSIILIIIILLAILLFYYKRNSPFGFGVTLGWKDGNTFVTKILKDGPADKAGLKVGNVIIEYNHQGMSNLSSKEEFLKKYHLLFWMNKQGEPIGPWQTINILYIKDGEEIKTLATMSAAIIHDRKYMIPERK